MSKAKRKCLFFVVFILCCVIFFGCSEKESEAMNKKTEPEGRLTRIEYSQTNGMVYGDDFSVDVIPEQVLYTRFFSTTEYEYVDKENIPIDSENGTSWKKRCLQFFLFWRRDISKRNGSLFPVQLTEEVLFLFV